MSRHQHFRYGEDWANGGIWQDQSLKRCFGVNKNVSRCDWEYLQTVTMVQEPHERVPKLTDLLEFLAQAENEHLWAFLDVKVINHFLAAVASFGMHTLDTNRRSS